MARGTTRLYEPATENRSRDPASETFNHLKSGARLQADSLEVIPLKSIEASILRRDSLYNSVHENSLPNDLPMKPARALALASLACLASAFAQDVTALHRDAFVMDAHMPRDDAPTCCKGSTSATAIPAGDVDLPRAREGGLDAMFFSIYTPEAYYTGRYEVKNTLRVLSLARDQIEKNHEVIEMALTASDIERINLKGKMAAFIDLEGEFDMDGDLNVLRGFYRLGLRSVQLTAHNYTNNYADSCCDVRKWQGLNEQGRKVVREMNQLGMVINVAHASEETMLQTVELSEDPVIFSHGGYRHFVDIPRSISDKAAKAIAAKGRRDRFAVGQHVQQPQVLRLAARRPAAPRGRHLDAARQLGGLVDRGSRCADGPRTRTPPQAAPG